MKRIEKYLDIRFNKHKKDWDTVIAVCGPVGVGKSNLVLHMLDYWQNKLHKECKPEDIKHMCLTGDDFKRDLSDCKPNEFTAFDEAGEISSRSALTKFNRELMLAYQVIRADRIFTVLVLPDFWYLDSFFRNTRVKALFYVYQRGRVKVWLKNKLQKLSQLNERRIFKKYDIKPDVYDTFSIYKGVMAEKYIKLKQKKTSDFRKKLSEGMISNGKTIVTVSDIPKSLLVAIKARLLVDLGNSQQRTGDILGYSQRYIGELINDKRLELKV